jgi:DNA-binding response OmpR family regulator
MQHSYRIIIAEADAVLASTLTRLMLRHYPTAVVQTVGNGQEALDAYGRAEADLLLVSHGLPGMDGPTIIGTLGAHGDTLPIIGMSDNPGLPDYMAAGALAYLDDGELIGQIAALLRRFHLPTSRSVRYVGQTSGE